MNLNGKQIISIVGAIVSVLMVSTSQLTDLFGPGVAKTVISVAGLVNMILSSVMAAITSQGGTVHDVLNMPGVEHIDINSAANKTLATIAIDPSIDKISPTPQAMNRVTQTAEAA